MSVRDHKNGREPRTQIVLFICFINEECEPAVLNVYPRSNYMCLPKSDPRFHVSAY